MTTDEEASTPSKRRRVAAGVLTGLACLLTLFALVVPNQLGQLTPWAFLRIPVEALVAAAVLIFLPRRARAIVAAVLGALVGSLMIVRMIDMGFYAAFDRPFDLMFDWSFFGPAVNFLTNATGHVGAIAVVIGAIVLAVGVISLSALAAIRLSRLAARRRETTIRTIAVLAVVWVFCAVFSVQLTPGQPFAARSAAVYAYDEARQVRADMRDQGAFTDEVATDAFRDTPGSELLTALRGKDVVFTFIESYGRVAVQGSDIAPGVDKVLDDGSAALRQAGFASRSAFLTSPTFGGGSWLAHSTFQSGVWINNQRRYDNLITGDRFTFSHAFKRAGWRTVGDLPENMYDWPEGAFYQYDKLYDSRNVGYRGPKYFYAQMPDQYTMSAFQGLERAQPGHAPVMAEIDLVTSHTPWAPLPTMVDWNTVGDGAVFNPQPKAAKQPEDVWPDPTKIRAAYGESIQYSLTTLIQYVQNYGDNNLVLVFLGDHQPAPIVSGENASHDVPVTIVAKDPAVLDRIAGWGWQDGLHPDPRAPIWPMSQFRDRFLAAFGSQGTAGTR
ncbi:sulfatase [Actinocrispum wychmicini]|uniref:Phosphoglycerol transferase MdoB-like AlkP superfamily enzyme n=1 Tax=Actinocrispum wychmicini TaxID=1213861 RepID=A0A4R2IK24_9PSEU|nr:sulfatase [Actinocrispum wychmicini]TCO44189.1 phosphoglycerol transferase MdoB-like AlkP superfamily enzyme [Actinocrispum wychmicini]